MNVEFEADVEFEILAIYNPESGELGGATLRILNAVEDDYYM